MKERQEEKDREKKLPMAVYLCGAHVVALHKTFELEKSSGKKR
jgi:hypothetical protein